MNFYIYKNLGFDAEPSVSVRLGDDAWKNFVITKAREKTNEAGDVWRIAVKGIPASRLGDVITLTLTGDEGDEATMLYSPLTYVARQSVEGVDVRFVCRALYRYFKAAKAFFTKGE